MLVWQALTTQNKKQGRTRAVIAGAILAVLVFSYFYLWTAAVAWLACISLLWFYFRPSDRSKTAIVTAIVGVMLTIALVPYVYLLSHRTASLLLLSGNRRVQIHPTSNSFSVF